MSTKSLIDRVAELSGKKLVSFYNEAAEQLGMPAVKKFENKATAVRRTTEVLTKLQEQDSNETEPETATEPSPEPAKDKVDRRKRQMYFVYPFHGQDKLRRIKNSNSLRGRCAELLKKGATYKEVIGLVNQFDEDRGSSPGNVERRAYELIRLLNHYIGYGLRQDDEGRIFIHTDE